MPQVTDSKWVEYAGWDDVPHITEEEKTKQLAATPPHLRKARSLGIPSLGSGAIYPIDPEEFIVDPFPVPEFWYRGYGLDVGWNKTAAIFGALDRDSDVLYLISEHYRGMAEPEVHARAINARGSWQPGFIDPAAAGAGQIDGKRLKDLYIGLGLNLTNAENAVEAGLLEVYSRMSSGRLKVFRNLTDWQREHRLYRRDEKGKIVKKNDHLMDATRYLCMSASQMALRPAEPKQNMNRKSPAERYIN
ncbi:MAG: hypothetical protein AAFW97_14600 [Pseudomonadota bacterium]